VDAEHGEGERIECQEMLRVRDGGTLYLIAESRDDRPSPVASLFAALVMEIYHQATLEAAQTPGSRLDPTMLWALVISSPTLGVSGVTDGAICLVCAVA
jgi:hypothetical protein